MSSGVPTPRAHSVAERLIRALLLQRTLYEEVAVERTALSEALGVVILAGIANGLALVSVPGTVGMLIGIAVSLVGWMVLSGIVFATGRWGFRARAGSFRSVAACLGFAEAPAVLNFLRVLPAAGPAVRIIVGVWLLAATMVAARAAFTVSPRRGAAIGGLGFTFYLLIGILLEIWAS